MEVPEALNPDEDIDALFQKLEDDDEIAARYREQRFRELQERANKLETLEQSGHGLYTELTVEKDLLKVTTTVPFVVVHFCHDEFRRCKIVDAHMKVEKRARGDPMEPRISGAFDSIVGFEELGNTDNFSTDLLEKRLKKCGVVSTDANVAPVRPTRTGIYSSSDRPTPLDDED